MEGGCLRRLGHRRVQQLQDGPRQHRHAYPHRQRQHHGQLQGGGSILSRRLLTACGHGRADGWHQADAQGIHKGGRQGKQSHAEGVFPVEGRGGGF